MFDIDKIVISIYTELEMIVTRRQVKKIIHHIQLGYGNEEISSEVGNNIDVSIIEQIRYEVYK